MKKILKESIDDYNINNDIISEAVGPEDLETDLYQGTKKLGKTAAIGAGLAAGAVASKGIGTAKSRIFIPMMLKKYKNDIAKDIDKWNGRYDGEFLKITDEAIKRLVAAKPQNVNDPTAIQQYNTNVKSIIKSYKNSYIQFLNGLHGILKRDFAVYTKRIIKNLSTKGFGSITERGATRLTNKWDNIIRDLNHYAHKAIMAHVDKVEAKIDNDLGPNSALGQVLHERPTAFFTSDDYNKITSFLNDTIVNVTAKEPQVAQDDTSNQQNDNSNEKVLSLLKSRYEKINNILNSGQNFSRADIIESVKKSLERLNNIDETTLDSNELSLYESLRDEFTEIKALLIKQQISEFAYNSMYDIYATLAQNNNTIVKAYSKDDIKDFGDMFADRYYSNKDAHNKLYKALKDRNIKDVNTFDSIMKKYK